MVDSREEIQNKSMNEPEYHDIFDISARSVVRFVQILSGQLISTNVVKNLTLIIFLVEKDRA